eukprot:5524611-Pyramimonas_sp.AAC.1
MAAEHDVQGEHRRTWDDTVANSSEEPTPGGWGAQGPRTVRWLMKQVRDNGNRSFHAHEIWVRLAQVPSDGRSVYEHE